MAILEELLIADTIALVMAQARRHGECPAQALRLYRATLTEGRPLTPEGRAMAQAIDRQLDALAAQAA